MTAPYTLPPQGKTRNPFDDLPDLPQAKAAAPNPFDDLPDLSAATLEKERHAKILRDNELGRRRDAQEPSGFGDQIASGAKDVYAAVRHPWETVKGLATHAAEDLGTVAKTLVTPPTDYDKTMRAGANTAATALLPIMPVTSIGARGAINATLGAVNMPDQPLRGATAGLILGEGLHRAPEFLPSRVQAPKVRLGETSEALRGSEFRRGLRIDDAPPIETAERPVAAPPEGFEPTAKPARPLNLNPRNPKGFTAEVNPFDDLPDLVGKQKPIATEPASAPLQDAADLSAAVTPDPALLAQIEAMRPRRRPAVAPVADSVAAEPAPAQPSEPLPTHPEGFSMGGALTDSRIPSAGELPKPARGVEPPPEIVESPRPAEAIGTEADPWAEIDAAVEQPAVADPSTGTPRGHLFDEHPHTIQQRQIAVERDRMMADAPIDGVPEQALRNRLEVLDRVAENDLPEHAAKAKAVADAIRTQLGESLPEGVPKPAGPLLNPASFPENVRPALAAADQGLQDAGVRKTAVTMDEQRLQARTFAHQMADDIGVNRLDLDPKKVGRLTGSEIGAIKEAAVGEMDKIIALEQQMADPMTPDAAKVGLSQLLEQAKQNRDTALGAVVRASSQKGRDLGFLRQVAHRTLDPDVWMLQAKKALGDLPLTDEVVANLRGLVRAASEACG